MTAKSDPQRNDEDRRISRREDIAQDKHSPLDDDIARRLAARTCVAAPAGHRGRVLAAVGEALAGSGGGQPSSAREMRVIETGALVAMAFSAAAVLITPWLVVPRPAVALSPEPRIVAQARAAGIDLPTELLATTAGPRSASRPTTAADGRQPTHAFEAWQLRNLMHGDL